MGIAAVTTLSRNYKTFPTQQKHFVAIFFAGNYTFPVSRFAIVNERGIDMIKLMLKVNPNKRLSIGEALNQKWVSENYSLYAEEQFLNIEKSENSKLKIEKCKRIKKGKKVDETVFLSW